MSSASSFRGRPRRYGRCVAAAGVALAILSCGRHGPRSPAAKPALELVQTEGFTFTFHRLSEGHYVAYGTSTAAVHEPLRIVEVRPLEVSGAVSFARADVAYFACQPNCRARPGYWGISTLLGAVCGPVMPRSRALYPAAGAELLPGDAPTFVLVMRVTGAGTASARGLDVVYDSGGRRHEIHSRVSSVELDDTEPARVGQCGDPATEAWFGGSREARLLRRL